MGARASPCTTATQVIRQVTRWPFSDQRYRYCIAQGHQRRRCSGCQMSKAWMLERHSVLRAAGWTGAAHLAFSTLVIDRNELFPHDTSVTSPHQHYHSKGKIDCTSVLRAININKAWSTRTFPAWRAPSCDPSIHCALLSGRPRRILATGGGATTLFSNYARLLIRCICSE